MKVLSKWSRLSLVLIYFFCTYHALGQSHEHTLWTHLLQKYVDADGQVDYAGWKKNPDELEKYLTWLSEQDISQINDSKQQLAYWINMYNAYTIALVLEYYPVKSIRDIQAEDAENPWKIKYVRLSDRRLLSLDEIENLVIRKTFSEPRIHFALVCAAKSCPSLRQEAYVGSKLDEQLQDQGRVFMNDSRKNQFHNGLARMSAIFDWFREDFGSSREELIHYLNRYTREHIPVGVTLEYMTYDWRLNDQKK